jgi:FAD/FMN-containing dehydrogenase
MIDRKRQLIARCADVADVIAAVKFAREHKLPLSIGGGGHNARLVWAFARMVWLSISH